MFTPQPSVARTPSIITPSFFPLLTVTIPTPQAFCDLEPIYSYEGAYDINSLVTGREITGIASFKPAALAKARL